MKIEVVDGAAGLVLVHVLGKERLACEAAYNRFLLNHNLNGWNLIVRTNFLDRTLFAQSINPDRQASQEINITQPSEIRAKLTELLEAELNQWAGRSSAAHAFGGI